ncbi:T9SS type A sorting domain-containing protein [Parabacteroides bouchesdurhonensis]|uniref:T9SS type A sorting domain-containing protein n=1 Tax=Parabacteroides bouchesdurhonensis TaxID=1936995 RepID=UPI000E46DBB1|nr:T9SS type A sorting domain-containing protein [Parabacteroides bouchesdurhonensis]RHJ90841.1 T9SS C-terminal target domain-containing protein [Bacteroides sp. AM07-16]
MKHLLVLAGLFISIWIQAQVYDFPVKPGSAMWNNFETHQQMLDACQIPENVLSKMSTEDLVTTCLNYPLSIDCFAYDNEVKGVQAVSQQFNGFRELLQRPDGVSKLQAALTGIQQNSTNRAAVDYPTFKKTYLLNAFLSLTQETAGLKGLAAKQAAQIYTPKGSLVPDTEILPEQFNAARKESIKAEYIAAYPQATYMGEATTTYNCHAYAWVGPNPGVWMGMNANPTSIYWRDGSYIESIKDTESGYKVSYASDNHSAVTTSTKGMFISKWGQAPLMKHRYDYCPYNASTLNYYRAGDFVDGYVITTNFGRHDFMGSPDFNTSAPPYGTVEIYITDVGSVTWSLISAQSTVSSFSSDGRYGKVVGCGSSSPAIVKVSVTAYNITRNLTINIHFNPVYSMLQDSESSTMTIKRSWTEDSNEQPQIRMNVSAQNRPYSYEIYNVSTASLAKKNSNIVNDMEYVDISALPKGIYLLVIKEGDTEVYQQKFSIK